MAERAPTPTSARVLIDRQAETLGLYHEAYAAHHGDNGPAGCPCCAEFAPRIAAAFAALQEAIEEWGRSG